MQQLRLFRELLTIVILSAVGGIMLAATFSPTEFGKWLQQIDQSRYMYVDQHCYEPI
jgi:hypothetical protein